MIEAFRKALEAQRFRRARVDHRAAWAVVIKHNGLATHIAKQFAGKGMGVDDLASEGRIGLLTAARKFDARRGTKFSDYAAYWVKDAVRRAILNKGKTVRCPEHTLRMATAWQRHVKACGEKGVTPDLEEFAAGRKTVPAAIHAAVATLNTNPFEYDPWYEEGVTDSFEHAEELDRVLKLLGELDREIVAMRFEEDMTLAEIGKHYGKSHTWAGLKLRRIRKRVTP